jgi:hypothetical protein
MYLWSYCIYGLIAPRLIAGVQNPAYRSTIQKLHLHSPSGGNWEMCQPVYLTQVCMPHILHRRSHPCVSFWSAQVSQVTASGADMDAVSEELFRQLSSGENVDLKAMVAHHRPPLPAVRRPAPGHRPAAPSGASVAEAAAAAAQKRTGQMADAVSLLENRQVGPQQRAIYGI